MQHYITYFSLHWGKLFRIWPRKSYEREIRKGHLYSQGPCKTELMIQFTISVLLSLEVRVDNSREIDMKNKSKKANIRGLIYRAGHSFTTTTACCLVSQSLSITHNFMSMRPMPSLGMLKRQLDLFNVLMLIFLKIFFSVPAHIAIFTLGFYKLYSWSLSPYETKVYKKCGLEEYPFY